MELSEVDPSWVGWGMGIKVKVSRAKHNNINTDNSELQISLMFVSVCALREGGQSTEREPTPTLKTKAPVEGCDP